MRLYLLGYMGSGKSRVGQNLADFLGFDFMDMDDYIEERYRISIHDFFDKYGEGAFRIAESKILKETITRDDIVIATGGGTPCYFDNIDFINEHGISVYLKVEPAILAERLHGSRKKRPVISNVRKEDLDHVIVQQLYERELYYIKARHVIDVSFMEGDEIEKAVLAATQVYVVSDR